MNSFMILFHGVTAPSWLGPPHCPGFTITLRQTERHTHTFVTTPLDERSARRRDL